MTHSVFKLAALSVVSATWFAGVSLAQGFGESSFEPSAGGGTAPAPARTQPSTGGGGFDEGSFDPGGGGATPIVAPPQGGGTVPGGDDFPGNDALPDVPGGGGIAPAPNPNPTPAPNPTPQPQPQPQPQPGPNTGMDQQVTAFETRDFGVPPQNTLRQGQFHAPTPTAVPGGYLVTTSNLVQAINNGTQMVIIDVLGSGYGLPNAYNAPALASAGRFNDRTQQQAAAWLRQITQGRQDMPIVIYCSDPMCWLSYNASLRAINAGYSQVYWYRGGIRAWQMLGLPMQPSGF